MDIESLSNEEKSRYSRHITLREIGAEGQLKLKNSRVLVVGAGGLGCPVLSYLTAAGIGKIGIVDYDVIELSNLQRQTLYSVDDIGKSKAETAAKKLKSLNPNVELSVYNYALTTENAPDIITAYDVVIDGCDNIPTRYLLNDACILYNKPLIYGSIYQFEGQVSLFNYEAGPNYRDLFPTPPPQHLVPGCAEGGVMGVLPGIIGSMQAVEAIKLITGAGELLAGRQLLYDALSHRTRILNIRKQIDNKTIQKLINYDEFCGTIKSDSMSPAVKEITVSELKKMIDDKVPFQLIDVREPNEFEFANIGGELIPLGKLTDHTDEISKDKPVLMFCRSGRRSEDAVLTLQQRGFDNCYNVVGGILAWSDEIDSSIPKY